MGPEREMTAFRHTLTLEETTPEGLRDYKAKQGRSKETDTKLRRVREGEQTSLSAVILGGTEEEGTRRWSREDKCAS